MILTGIKSQKNSQTSRIVYEEHSERAAGDPSALQGEGLNRSTVEWYINGLDRDTIG